MKIECLKNKLKGIVSAAEKITSKNHSLPVLNLIILETGNNNLKIKSTNLEVGFEGYLPVKITKPGQIAVNAQILNQLLSSIPDSEEKINLELSQSNLIIKTNKLNTILKTYSIDDFPIIPKIKNGYVFNLPINYFILGVKSVIYASATSDIKPEIASVYLYQNNDELIFVATDSFRLAEKKIKFNNKDNFIPLIIPIKNISEIIKVIENENGDLEIQSSEHQVSFITSNFNLTSRVINSVFPDYRQIIPKTKKTEININKNYLLNNLKLSNIFSNKFNQITFKINPPEFKIFSQNQDIGEVELLIPGSVEGEDLIVNFNARYIIEAIPSFSDDLISLNFTEKNKPLLINSAKDKTFNYLVMPVNR